MINWLIEQMVCRNIINNDDKDIYTYGLKVATLYFLSIITALLISSIISNLYLCLITIILFVPIRRFLGGFHFRNPYMCFICSEIYILLPIAIMPYLLNFKRYLSQTINILFILILTVTYVFKAKISSKRKCYPDSFKIKCTKTVMIYEFLYWLFAHFCLYNDFISVTCIIIYIFASQLILFLIPEQSYT